MYTRKCLEYTVQQNYNSFMTVIQSNYCKQTYFGNCMRRKHLKQFGLDYIHNVPLSKKCLGISGANSLIHRHTRHSPPSYPSLLYTQCPHLLSSRADLLNVKKKITPKSVCFLSTFKSQEIDVLYKVYFYSTVRIERLQLHSNHLFYFR